MTLLGEIREGAVSSDVSISDLLRRFGVFAARIGNDEMAKWAERELNGYGPEIEGLPDYRVASAHAYGNFGGPLGASLRRAPIPGSHLPEAFEAWGGRAYLREPVRVYEDLLKQSDSNGTMHTPWPGDLIAHMARKIYKGYSMISAWTEFPRGVVIGHPRSHVLRIQADFPEAEGHTRRKAIANRRS